MRSFPFKGTGFHLALYCSMEIDFESAYLGKRHAVIMGQGKANLGKTETIISVFALKARIARGFTLLASAKEGFDGFVHAAQHILQYLAWMSLYSSLMSLSQEDH